jgi:hypothetical protein
MPAFYCSPRLPGCDLRFFCFDFSRCFPTTLLPHKTVSPVEQQPAVLGLATAVTLRLKFWPVWPQLPVRLLALTLKPQALNQRH